MPPKAMTFKTPDGKEFATRAEWRDYMMSTFYTYKDKKNETLVKNPGDIDGQVFDIGDCSGCTLVVMDKCEQVQIDNCNDCRIFIGACASSIFARNCTNCVFYTVCRQLRLREVTNSTLYIYSMAEVHIEYSNALKFACFNGGYPQQEVHMNQLKLDIQHNLWYDIFDHNDQAKSRVNWCLLPKEEYEEVWFPAGAACEVAIKRTEPGSVQRDDGQVGQSFGVDQMIADSVKTAAAAPPSIPTATFTSPVKQTATSATSSSPLPPSIPAAVVNNSVSFFNAVPLEPPNAILGLALDCKNDTCPTKIDLTIGAYRDENGKPQVLQVVRDAEVILQQQQHDHEYLPQDGLPLFNQVSQVLMFGDDSKVLKENRVYTIQSLSGTGCLRLASDFIGMHLPSSTCYIPQVTWQNHSSILAAASVKQGTYRYIDGTGCALDFNGMIEDISQAVEGSIILLHNCAHNPTGVDPTEEQWRTILQICQTRRLLAFFDNAYQGFVSGNPAIDAYAVRLFADAGMEMIAACSFAKNFGLYGERVGALHYVVSRSELKATIGSQLRSISRTLYSTCPSYGARIVSIVLSNPVLRSQWESQCGMMAARLSNVRKCLYDCLLSKNVKGQWDHVIKQRGMFSYTGIPAPVVARLKDEYHIYMLSNGRISLAGLNTNNIEVFVTALAYIIGSN